MVFDTERTFDARFLFFFLGTASSVPIIRPEGPSGLIDGEYRGKIWRKRTFEMAGAESFHSNQENASSMKCLLPRY